MQTVTTIGLDIAKSVFQVQKLLYFRGKAPQPESTKTIVYLGAAYSLGLNFV